MGYATRVYERLLRLDGLLRKKSFFLFGPRATGKSTLIASTFPNAPMLNLLDSRVYLRLAQDPSALESFAPSGRLSAGQLMVIDEVQKLPELLDEVHRLIELRKAHFLLTGSSARKLRFGRANLLAGRAWRADLFPLTLGELGEVTVERYLRYGGLPAVCTSEAPEEELAAYVDVYLREEIQAEGLVRKLPAFARFLRVAALSSAQIINFQAVASDSAVPANTVRDYFGILEDTLLGFLVEPWRSSRKRKATATAKFYLFDTGVFHTLIGTEVLDRNSDLFGRTLEQMVALELRAYLSYRRVKNLPLTFWRSESGFEVDFLLGERVAIEVKATKRVTEKDKRGLRALKDEGVFKQFYLLSFDPLETKRDGIHTLSLSTFLERLWSGGIA